MWSILRSHKADGRMARSDRLYAVFQFTREVAVKIQLVAISDQVCEASDAPEGPGVAGYPVVELAALEVPEGKIRDIFCVINQAKDLVSKFDGTRLKNLIAWWGENGDEVISVISKIIAMFGAFASPAPAPVQPPAPTPPPVL